MSEFTIPLVLCAVGLLFSLSISLYARYAETETRRISHLTRWREEFFDSVQPLLTDEETPVELIASIQKVSKFIDDKYAAPALYHCMKQSVSTPNDSEPMGTINQFLEQRPELRESFFRFLRSFVLAISFNDSNVGPQLRELFAEVLADPNKNKAVAQTVQALKRTEPHGADGCLMPA